MADNTAAKTTATPEQRIDAIVGSHMKADGKAAMAAVMKASPEHADEIIKSLDHYKETFSIIGMKAPKEAEDRLKKAFVDAAVDASVGNKDQQEAMVKALTTIAANGDKPIPEEKIRTDLDKAVKAEEEYRKSQAAAVAAGQNPEDTAEFKARKKKAEEEAEAAKKAGQKASENVGDDIWSGLLKLIVKAIAGWLGIDLDKKDEPAKTDTPAADGVTFRNEKGETTILNADKLKTFLKDNGVDVQATEKPADGMWAAIDKLRKEAGLTERVGKHEFDVSDAKMLDKVHTDHEAKKTSAAPAKEEPAVTTAGLTTKTLTEDQLHVLVASATKHPEMAKHVEGDESKLRAAVAKFQKDNGIVEEKGKEGTLDEKTIGALVAGYAKANGLSDKDAAKVNQHLNDDVTRITAAPTPPKVEVAAAGQAK